MGRGPLGEGVVEVSLVVFCCLGDGVSLGFSVVFICLTLGQLGCFLGSVVCFCLSISFLVWGVFTVPALLC